MAYAENVLDIRVDSDRALLHRIYLRSSVQEIGLSGLSNRLGQLPAQQVHRLDNVPRFNTFSVAPKMHLPIPPVFRHSGTSTIRSSDAVLDLRNFPYA